MEYKSIKEEKFDSIYRAHVDSIFKVVMHYTKDYDISQEMTQSAFFQLYTHMDDVDLEYVYPWLVRTTRNLLYNHNRDSKREILGEAIGAIMASDPLLHIEENMEEHYLRDEQKRMAEDLSDSIFEKLYKKNRGWYDAITLVYCLGKPQQEVADELGVTIGVLQSRIHRAKTWIRKKYERKYEKVINWF